MKILANSISFLALLAWCAAALGNDCPGGICPWTQQPQYQYQQPPQQQYQPYIQPLQPSQTPPSQDILDSVVQVHNGSVNGSGTVIEVSSGYALVVSCNHLFHDGAGRLSISFRNGGRASAELLGADPTNDLSAFAVELPRACKPVTVATREPSQQEMCTTVGWGPGQLAYYNGVFSEMCVIQVEGSPGLSIPALEIRGSVRPGDSGGPVLNADWELCGTIIGTDDVRNSTLVNASQCRPLRDFLDGIRQRWRQRFGGGDLAGIPKKPPQPQGPHEGTPSESPLEDIAKAAGTGLLTKILIGAGVASGPAGLLAAGAMWISLRRVKKRLNQPAEPTAQVAATAPACNCHPQQSPQQTQPVIYERRVTEAAAPPPVVVDERYTNVFSTVPDTTREKALSRAIQIYVNRYPGSEATINAVCSLRDQILKGTAA